MRKDATFFVLITFLVVPRCRQAVLHGLMVDQTGSGCLALALAACSLTLKLELVDDPGGVWVIFQRLARVGN